MPSISMLAIGSAVFGAVGTLAEGQAQANAANYNAEVARMNAAHASAAGSQQATMESLKGAAIGGQLKAQQSANNVDVNTGSALKVQQGQREASELNAATTENNALLEAYGYKSQAALDSAEAQQAVEGSWFKAAGGLLGDASSLGPKWDSLFSGDSTAAATGAPASLSSEAPAYGSLY